MLPFPFYKVWNMNTGECVRNLIGHLHTIVCLVHVRSRLNVIASGSYDKTIKVWNIQTGACLQTLYGQSDWLRCLILIEKNENKEYLLASGSNDCSVKLWSPINALSSSFHFKCTRTFRGHSGSIISLIFNPNTCQLISDSADNRIKLWNLETGDCLHTLESHSYGVMSLILNMNEIVTSSYDGNIKVNL